MKTAIKTTFVFAVMAILFSGLSGCGGGSQATPSGNLAQMANAVSNQGQTRDSEYPMLVPAIANADIELIDGTKFKLADRKGKVLMLNLWGVWCGPCRIEMPHLVEMQDKFRDQGFQVIGLNIGDEDLQPDSAENIQKFAAEMKLNYELARIDNNLTNEFNKLARFDGVPISMLIDREGRLRGVFAGAGPKVITRMKEVVPQVIEGKETITPPGEPVNKAPDQKLEVKEADGNKPKKN